MNKDLPNVYVETSVFSYLAARPSRDIITLARQELTRDWWENHRSDFALHVAALVISEAGRGDPSASSARLSYIRELPVLRMTSMALELAERLLSVAALPVKASDDALHIALAAVHGMDFLLTWNFKHINNIHTEDRIKRCLEEAGLASPVLCSPEELLGGSNE